MHSGITELTDAALVSSALGDDGEAFGHLYRRFYPRLVRLIVRKTGDRSLAEDVAQEALLRALDKLDTFDRSRPLWPWLKVIATNLAVDAGRKRSREVEWEPEEAAGMPAKELPSCEDGMVLAQVLANLPDRQRVAVSLKYLQDWESSEAASFLGLSTPAFEQLLFRARKRLRLEYSRIAQGALGVFGASGRWLRRLAARTPGARRAMEATSQLGPVTWAQAAAGGFALLVAVPATPAIVRHESRGVPAAVAPADEGEGSGVARAGASGGEASPRGAAKATSVAPPVDERPDAPPATDEPPSLKDITDPTHRVQEPEDAEIISMAYAPDAPGGKRAFAVGDAHCGVGTCSPVLFTTNDGGSTWRRLPAHGFSGYEVVVPPGSDGTKLFAMSPAGLQVSTDGGRTFSMAALTGVAPVTGSVAVSPAFDRGDPIMLIGAQTLLRYDDSQATIQPEPSTTLNGPFEPVFSPSYLEDQRFFLGGQTVDREGRLRSTVFDCSDAMCIGRTLGAGGAAPKIRFRPDFAESHVMFAFTDHYLYRTADAWGFTAVETPWTEESWLRDVALVGSGRTMYAAVQDLDEPARAGLYRSEDGGRTWSKVRSPLFAEGAATIAVRGRRMLVALPAKGLACSSDGGVHWSGRC